MWKARSQTVGLKYSSCGIRACIARLAMQRCPHPGSESCQTVAKAHLFITSVWNVGCGSAKRGGLSK